MFSIFSKQPKYLRVILYENGKPLDIEKLYDDQIKELRLAILKLWETPKQSAIMFDCMVYEHPSWFRRTKDTEFNVECFIHDPNTIPGQRRIRIPKLYQDKFAGRKMTITPEDTVFRKWKHPIHAEFVVPS